MPEGISVLGFDNQKFSSLFQPCLTTIAQPAFESCEKAVELLLRLINKEVIKQEQMFLDDQLIVRQSFQQYVKIFLEKNVINYIF
ncbi:substrate-binding domain-containing protein [Mesobacillus foraminis]|uniref:Substrate-binding family protein n=1 Tax=Mesobacillus foraminis TaxID=279826 RepID=A0A4R2B3L0_9BACI|nr:substrate-binding domain-containing protein [Mesobacillus foraminis]TCN21198.1 substrate-binding family protein [Mesobacillus foraminis]